MWLAYFHSYCIGTARADAQTCKVPVLVAHRIACNRLYLPVRYIRCFECVLICARRSGRRVADDSRGRPARRGEARRRPASGADSEGGKAASSCTPSSHDRRATTPECVSPVVSCDRDSSHLHHVRPWRWTARAPFTSHLETPVRAPFSNKVSSRSRIGYRMSPEKSEIRFRSGSLLPMYHSYTRRLQLVGDCTVLKY